MSCTYTWREVEKHNTKDDCWIVLEGKVYDVTDYIQRHPGGSAIILKNAGTDCTEKFRAVHPWVNYEKALGHSLVGTIERRSGAADKL